MSQLVKAVNARRRSGLAAKTRTAGRFDPSGQIMFCRRHSSNLVKKRDLRDMRPERYDVRESERKWQKAWADEAIFATRNDDPRPKYYVLEM
ncbi:MAG: hypothetical protein ABSC22_18650, partial [Roseiarcus sp.]